MKHRITHVYRIDFELKIAPLYCAKMQFESDHNTMMWLIEDLKKSCISLCAWKILGPNREQHVYSYHEPKFRYSTKSAYASVSEASKGRGKLRLEFGHSPDGEPMWCAYFSCEEVGNAGVGKTRIEAIENLLGDSKCS